MSENDRFGEDYKLTETLQKNPVVLNTVGGDRTVNEPINPGAAIINSEYQDLILSYPGVIANIPELEKFANSCGFTNFSFKDGSDWHKDLGPNSWRFVMFAEKV
jgi:hypothetical protein